MDKVKDQRVIASGLREAIPNWFAEIVSSQRTLLTMTIRALAITMVSLAIAPAPRTASAQSAQEPTQMSIGAPAQTILGDRIYVQAVLVDSRGNRISKATVYFTTPATLLGQDGDVLLAQAMTNKDGQAVAQFENDFSGTITLRAEFRGDERYAPSDVTTQVAAVGDEQVYIEHVGVDIPGLNVPPLTTPMVALKSPTRGVSLLIEGLWPSMSGWPIAAALIIVWSLYLLAVTLTFRVATSESERKESTFVADRRRSP